MLPAWPFAAIALGALIMTIAVATTKTGPRIRRISSRSPAALARPRKGRNSFTRGSYQPQGPLRFPLAAGRRAEHSGSYGVRSRCFAKDAAKTGRHLPIR